MPIDNNYNQLRELINKGYDAGKTELTEPGGTGVFCQPSTVEGTELECDEVPPPSVPTAKPPQPEQPSAETDPYDWRKFCADVKPAPLTVGRGVLFLRGDASAMVNLGTHLIHSLPKTVDTVRSVASDVRDYAVDGWRGMKEAAVTSGRTLVADVDSGENPISSVIHAHIEGAKAFWGVVSPKLNED